MTSRIVTPEPSNTASRTDANGNNVFNMTYNDADFEEGMAAENAKPVQKSKEEDDKAEKIESRRGWTWGRGGSGMPS